jgi:hypothetical protein
MWTSMGRLPNDTLTNVKKKPPERWLSRRFRAALPKIYGGFTADSHRSWIAKIHA